MPRHVRTITSWPIPLDALRDPELLYPPSSPLFASTIYMILGRIIRLTSGDKHAVVSSRTLTKFFCFVLQGAGT